MYCTDIILFIFSIDTQGKPTEKLGRWVRTNNNNSININNSKKISLKPWNLHSTLLTWSNLKNLYIYTIQQ